jgi:hypothetical protein
VRATVYGCIFIIHYVNLNASRKYRPAATQGGFKIDRSCEEFMGCMVFYEVDEKAIS